MKVSQIIMSYQYVTLGRLAEVGDRSHTLCDITHFNTISYTYFLKYFLDISFCLAYILEL